MVAARNPQGREDKGMSGEDQTVEQEAAPPDAQVATAPPADDLDSLLAEYDATAPSGEDAAPVAEQPVAEATGNDVNADLHDWALDVETERLTRRENEETASVMAEGREAIADLNNLPQDFADKWLRNEYLLDAELQHAWDGRHNSEDANRVYKGTLRRAMNKMFAQAEREHSRIEGHSATEDKDSIVAAMVRAASRTAPAETPPSYSNVSDGEFRDDVKRRYGFTPGI